jgi:phosphinothricin acetyltransferase
MMTPTTPAHREASPASTGTPAVQIGELLPCHWPEVADIFRQGLATGNATFETEVPSWECWDASHLHGHRFVALRDDKAIGWTAASPVSDRCVYTGVVEDSVYVAEQARGQAVGLALVGRLVESTEQAGIWTVQARVLAGNRASLVVHERAGFRVVGVRERHGKLSGVWHDVVLLERRSKTVG